MESSRFDGLGEPSYGTVQQRWLEYSPPRKNGKAGWAGVASKYDDCADFLDSDGYPADNEFCEFVQFEEGMPSCFGPH